MDRVTKLLVRVESLEYNDLPSEEREEIDFICSDDRFCHLAISWLRPDFPNAFIDVTTRSAQGPNVITVFGVDDTEIDDIRACVENKLMNLYALGDFWCIIDDTMDNV